MNEEKKVQNVGVEEEETKKYGSVVNGSLNIRKSPSLDANVLKVIKENDKVEILSDSDKIFFKVKFENVIGYCVKKFIKRIN